MACKTETAEASIKCAAQETGDIEMLCKVRDQDLGEREARCHNCCHREYTRSNRKHTANKDSESTQSQAAHNDAFQFSCGHILE